jgi:ATP-binding cassette subfamily B protein
VLILDESFAALDPETLKICLRVLLKQQRTVILIAHP